MVGLIAFRGTETPWAGRGNEDCDGVFSAYKFSWTAHSPCQRRRLIDWRFRVIHLSKWHGLALGRGPCSWSDMTTKRMTASKEVEMQ